MKTFFFILFMLASCHLVFAQSIESDPSDLKLNIEKLLYAENIEKHQYDDVWVTDVISGKSQSMRSFLLNDVNPGIYKFYFTSSHPFYHFFEVEDDKALLMDSANVEATMQKLLHHISLNNHLSCVQKIEIIRNLLLDIEENGCDR